MGGIALAMMMTGLIVGAGPAPDARELAKALSAERLGLSSGEATIVMELRDRAGRVVSRTIRARMAVAGGDRRMRLTFVAPADQRGVELLVLAERDEAPVQYLWLPRSAELRRIAGAERGGRFQGSDFSFADFEERDLAEAEVVVRGEEEVAGVACHHIAITARGGQRAGRALGDLEATRVEAWVTKDSRVALRVRFFRDDTLVRQLDVARLQPLAGARDEELVPTRLVMRDLVRETRTTLDIRELDPTARFPDAIFAPEALGR